MGGAVVESYLDVPAMTRDRWTVWNSVVMWLGFAGIMTVGCLAAIVVVALLTLGLSALVSIALGAWFGDTLNIWLAGPWLGWGPDVSLAGAAALVAFVYWAISRFEAEMGIAPSIRDIAR